MKVYDLGYNEIWDLYRFEVIGDHAEITHFLDYLDLVGIEFSCPGRDIFKPRDNLSGRTYNTLVRVNKDCAAHMRLLTTP